MPGGDLDNAVAAYHIRSEQAVLDSGIPGTFLRPSMFMTNALQWADQIAAGDVVRAPWAGLAAAVIDPVDIGEVAAVALVDGGHEGEALALTGPELAEPWRPGAHPWRRAGSPPQPGGDDRVRRPWPS